jgi:hypothetical protein
MAIRFTPGEDAVGADAAPLVKPVAKCTGNGAPAPTADKPLGLVDLDTRVAALEAKVEAQTARITALETALRETGETRQSHSPTGSKSVPVGDAQPWIAAGVSRSTWFRRQRQQATLPSNVVRFEAKPHANPAPSLESPELRAAP